MSRRDRALRAFADVILPGDLNEKGQPIYQGEPSGEYVWLYAGPSPGDHHLTLGDFRDARAALGMPQQRVFPGVRGVWYSQGGSAT